MRLELSFKTKNVVRYSDDIKGISVFVAVLCQHAVTTLTSNLVGRYKS